MKISTLKFTYAFLLIILTYCSPPLRPIYTASLKGNQSEHSVVTGTNLILNNRYFVSEESEKKYFSKEYIPSVEYHFDISERLQMGISINRIFANFNAFSVNERVFINFYSSAGLYVIIDAWAGHDLFNGIIIGWDVFKTPVKLNLTTGIIGNIGYSLQTEYVGTDMESRIEFERETRSILLPLHSTFSFGRLKISTGIDLPLFESSFLNKKILGVGNINKHIERIFSNRNLNVNCSVEFIFLRTAVEKKIKRKHFTGYGL